MAHVFSTNGDGVVGDSNDDFAMTADGTSFVAPQIAGIVGLMLKVNPDLSFWQVKHILEVTATDLDDGSGQFIGYDRFTGFGLVNARKAVEYTRKHYLPADWNGDNSVDTTDAALFTLDYANGELMSDLNLDATQSADDMAIFLRSYFAE
ncbi:MAG: hypothetical protein DYG94_13560 [Leptolyngbya sp. PLA3]|nr:MAG: hypothetical protein EDM82_14115 [Cyanobacteria bacterium CYA]MCE7969753.1 hypothetical protein [Leptolyngbya sp. PL-A3]